MKTQKFSCGAWSFTTYNNAITEISEYGRPGRYTDSLPMNTAYDLLDSIEKGDTPVPKLRLARMITDKISGFEWANILETNPLGNRAFVNRLSGSHPVIETMSHAMRERFAEYLKCREIPAGMDLPSVQNTGKKVEVRLRQVAAKTLDECTSIKHFKRLVLDGGTVCRAITEYEIEPYCKIYSRLQKGIERELAGYVDGVVRVWAADFKQAQIEIDRLNKYSKIQHEEGPAGTCFWIEGKKVAYAGNTECWPINIETCLFEFLNAHEDEIEEFIETLGKAGIDYTDITKQCRDEVRDGADISHIVERHAFFDSGVLSEVDSNTYRDDYDELTDGQFRRIWEKTMFEDFEGIGDFLECEDSSLRECVDQMLSEKTYRDFLESEDAINSIRSSYYCHCTGLLDAFLRKEAEKILAGRRYRDKKGGKK